MKRIIPVGLYIIFSMILSSCGGGGGGSSPPPSADIITNADLPNIDINALPVNGTLHAYFSVDGGQRQNMVISGNQADLNNRGLSPGNHNFQVEVVFVYNNAIEVTLASASISLQLNEGSNKVTFIIGDFSTSFDNDNDAVTNLTEMNAGSDPNDASCIIDVNVLDSCSLG